MRIKVNPRAFEDGQGSAMKNDLIRGLIELITNSNEAYGNNPGPIDIFLDGKKIKIIDYGTGIEDLEKSLEQGGMSANFHNDKTSRGRHGRGLKDVPILAENGSFILETVKRNTQEYFKVKWKTSAEIEGDTEDVLTSKPIPRNLNNKLKEGGTSITFKIKKRVRNSQPASLEKKLPSHIEMRDLLNQREVNFHVKDNKTTLKNPFQNTKKTLLHEEKLQLAGFEDYEKKYGEASFSLHRLENASDDLNVYSEAGIVLKGNGVSYNNDDFGFKNFPEMYYLSGEIDIPFIDALYKDYLENKENPNENNTINIVTIMREGLEPAHPLYKQIEILLKPILQTNIDQIKGENANKVYENSKNLKQASKVFSKIAKSLDFDDDNGPVENIIEFRPPFLKIAVEDKAHASLVTDKTIHVEGDSVTFSTKSKNINILETDKKLTPHLKNPELLSTTIEVEAMELGQAKISAESKGIEAYLEIEVSEPVPTRSIDYFQFENKSYSIPEGINSTKNITVLVPLKEFDKTSPYVILNIKDPELFTLKENTSELTYNTKYDCYAAEFQINNTKYAESKISSVIIAEYKNEKTRASLKVSDITPTSPELDIKFNPAPYQGNDRVTYRPATETSPKIYEVNLQHPVVRQVINKEPQLEHLNGDFERSFISEIILDRIIRSKIMEKIEEFDDADDAFRRLEQIRKEKYPQHYREIRNIKY
tara:strand:- start:744 stop:2864 length:2121 start_codon:yes stop_codon:yes gene_type:complete